MMEEEWMSCSCVGVKRTAGRKEGGREGRRETRGNVGDGDRYERESLVLINPLQIYCGVRGVDRSGGTPCP
jgi:hypothetical protein